MSSDPWGSIILQVVLILVNAFFSMAEMAAISINDNKLAKMAEGGNKRAIILFNLLKNPSAFLSTIQVGITLAGYLGAAFGASNFAPSLSKALGLLNLPISSSALDAISLVLVTLILSYFTLVFGELVPKRIAQRKGEAISLRIAGIINFIAVITRPVIWLLTISTNAVLRMFGIDPNELQDDVTEEEIRMLVDVGGEKGTIEEAERQMIDNVFEFNDRTAEELMTHRRDMVAFWIEDEADEIRDVILSSGMSRFPVYNEDYDDIIGTLNTKDYLMNLINENPKAINDMIRPPYFVPLNVTADKLLNDMQSLKAHMAIVVDEYGGTNGIITLEDLLEEIVGNIYDEYDNDEEEIVDLGDGVYRINGSTALEDVEKVFDIALPVDDFDTLGGLIFGQLSVIPDDGSTPEFKACGLEISVEPIVDHRVEWAKVKLGRAEEAEEATGKNNNKNTNKNNDDASDSQKK